MLVLLNNIRFVVCFLLFLGCANFCLAEVNFDKLDKVNGKGSDESSFSGVINKANKTQSELREQDERERASARERASSCSSCGNYVMVYFDVVAGFSTKGVDRVFSMSAPDGFAGHIQPNADKKGVAIHKNKYVKNGDISGYYQWSASWDKGQKFCSGKIYISGNKNVLLNVYEDCKPTVSEY